jgi:hypothetical protein
MTSRVAAGDPYGCLSVRCGSLGCLVAVVVAVRAPQAVTHGAPSEGHVRDGVSGGSGEQLIELSHPHGRAC